MEARLAHPAFAPLRRAFERLADPLNATLEELNVLAQEAGVTVESGAQLRFVLPPGGKAAYGDYELRVHATGKVETRPGNRHDLFNALAWLTYPRTKAALNALHAREIPRERGHRGRVRDLLTLLDEGGAIVACDDPALGVLVREMRWKALFWERREKLLRSMRILVLGHAVLERALEPWPGLTCKALFIPATGEPDVHAAQAVRALAALADPRAVPPLPVFGYPGWHPGTDAASFYEDERYFRPARRAPDRALAG